MKLKSIHLTGFVIGFLLLIIDLIVFLQMESRLFKPLIAISILSMILPFWLDIIKEGKRHKELEEKFLEFVRSITDSVKAGIPIPKAIIEVSHADYGALSPFVRKLAYQIEWGIPLRDAFMRFAKNTENKVIRRSMSIVIEAEQSGGNIQDVLIAVTNSVIQIKKIKEERRSNAFSQLIQGYFVFFIFIGIMVILQVYLMPQLTEISGTVLTGIESGITTGFYEGEGEATAAIIDFNTIFTGMILIQGFFAGLMVGKFAEGQLKAGLRHSLILAVLGYLIFTLATGF
ncbi:MAG: type II secretion system F family protein [Candidatus Woesearchaeota archaeon]